jgi:hypothetical protein
LNVLNTFLKKLKYQVVPCGQADRQTDMTKLIIAFRSFANAPKNVTGTNKETELILQTCKKVDVSTKSITLCYKTDLTICSRKCFRVALSLHNLTVFLGVAVQSRINLMPAACTLASVSLLTGWPVQNSINSWLNLLVFFTVLRVSCYF